MGSGNAQFKGQVDVKTIVNLGLQAEDIQICFNHRQQEIQVFVPRSPKLLELLHEDHKLVSGEVSYEALCFVKEIMKQKPLVASGSVNNGDFN